MGMWGINAPDWRKQGEGGGTIRKAKDEVEGLNDGHTMPHPSHPRKKYKANIAFMTINDGVSSSSSKEEQRSSQGRAKYNSSSYSVR